MTGEPQRTDPTVQRNARWAVTLAVALLAAGSFATAAAQAPSRTIGLAPPGADTLSAPSIADSLAVLRSLDSLVRREPNNAAAWFRRGMVAWALAHRDTIPPPVRETDWTLLGRLADTSFRRAAFAEPSNPLYHMMVGRYLLASGNSFARTGANAHFDRAADAAGRWEDPWLRAEALVEAGRVDWRRYDTFADRLPNPNGALRSLAQAANIDGPVMSSLRPLVDAAREAKAFAPTAESGEADYLKAELRFREAYAAYPEHVRAFRSLAMLLAEKKRWTELAAVARDKVQRAPWDYLGWMTLGLATYRLGDATGAVRAFESAMEHISTAEYQRLDRLDRVLSTRASATSAFRDPYLKPAATRLYWMFSNPLWSQPGGETRVEFLARVTYAELRWTVDELGVRGADTDRGDVHIRYGPPDHVVAWGPDPDGASFESRSVSTLWGYEKSGLSFIFQGQPTFATARIPLSDREFYARQVEDVPVRWDNTAVVQVDTIPTQAVRFRGVGDSVDVLIAAAPPVAAIRASSDVQGLVRTDFWLLAGGTLGVHRDSTLSSPTGVQWWRQRVPLGTYVYRVEASADAALRAGRAAVPVVANHEPFSGFLLRGFSASDVLLATSVTERRSAPTRWSDLDVVPLAGPIPRGAQLGLVWENYGLGARDGSADYTVAITIRRDASVAGRVAARILGGAGGVTSTMRTDDAVSIQFSNRSAHRDIIVDHLEVGLGDSPPGNYTLILRVTDRVTGERSERTTRFTIAPGAVR
jgi:GWxTD domain-containing protein